MTYLIKESKNFAKLEFVRIKIGDSGGRLLTELRLNVCLYQNHSTIVDTTYYEEVIRGSETAYGDEDITCATRCCSL